MIRLSNIPAINKETRGIEGEGMKEFRKVSTDIGPIIKGHISFARQHKIVSLF